MITELLCTDLHLTDSPTEEYRWEFLEKILPELIEKHEVSKVWILGDAFDRKDRHSSKLVNRFYKAFSILREKVSIVVLMGNHDMPVNGTPYWEILNLSSNRGVTYITTPENIDGVLCLPYSHNPIKDWAKFNLSSFSCIMMHQTISGALCERDRKLESNTPLPIFPRGVPVYSGDVHRPQKIGTITYVGTPYPVRFGEDWPGQILLIKNKDYANPETIILPSIQRKILELNPANIESISTKGFKKGDQVRVRFQITSDSLSCWGEDERRIRELLTTSEVECLSVEANITAPASSTSSALANTESIESMSFEETLQAFATEEGLSEELVGHGIDIIRST